MFGFNSRLSRLRKVPMWQKNLLLLGGSLLSCGLLGSLLCCGLLGSLLCCGFLGSLLSGLLSLLGFLNLSSLELTSSLASGLSLDNGSGSKSLPEGKLQGSSSLGGVNLVVGHDILEDGLAG